MATEAEVRALAAGVLLPGFTGHTAPDWLRRRVASGLGGVVLFGRNVVDDGQVAELTASLRAERDGVVVAIDEEGGDVTRLDAATGSIFPGNFALGTVNDPELTHQVAAVLGARLADCGITVDLAPCADITRGPSDPIIGVRSFSTDAAVAGHHTAAFVTGLQSAGVAACAKHFPGHGGAGADSHRTLPVLARTERQLHEAEFVPFAAAIAAGVRSVMTGHLVVPAWGEAPATLNGRALRALRTELAFTGTVITDALDMAAVANTVGIAEGAVRALLAGADTLCIGGDHTDEATVETLTDSLVRATRSGRLPIARLARAADRTASLGVTTASGAHQPSRPDPEIGLIAARRALRVRGDATPRAPLVVADLVAPASIAVGDVPWGLGRLLSDLLPGTSVVRIAQPGTGAVDTIAATADGGTVVVVTRDARHHPWMVDLLHGLNQRGIDLIQVETGIPGPGPATRARLDTHGGSSVCLRAAAEYLAAMAGVRRAEE